MDNMDEFDYINNETVDESGFEEIEIDEKNFYSVSDMSLELKEEMIYSEDKPYRETFAIPIQHIIRIEENDRED